MDFADIPQEGTSVNLVPLGDIRLTEQNDRFTLRIDAYWETFYEDPFGHHLAVSKALQTRNIEPYSRKFKATEEPRELVLGDIRREDVGYILAVNIEGTRLRQNPTEEEMADIQSRVAVFQDFEIHPFGMPFLGQPLKNSPLTIRCLHGQATLQVYIFPR